MLMQHELSNVIFKHMSGLSPYPSVSSASNPLSPYESCSHGSVEEQNMQEETQHGSEEFDWQRAHEVMRWRKAQKLAKKQIADQEVVEKKVQEHYEVYKAQLEKKRLLGKFKMRPTGPREKEIKDDDTGPKISVIVKGDVDGSVEAILDVLETYDCNADCTLNLIHYGVGMLEALAKSKRVVIKQHNIIYRLVDDLKAEINSRLPLKPVEEILGHSTAAVLLDACTSDMSELGLLLKHVLQISVDGPNVNLKFLNQMMGKNLDNSEDKKPIDSVGGIKNVEFTSGMLHAARRASSKRREAIEEMKKKESEEANRSKTTLETVNKLEAKKRKLLQQAEEEASALQTEIDLEKKRLRKILLWTGRLRFKSWSGEANVLQEFKVTEGKKKVSVAGCRCVKGHLKKSAQYRLLRGQQIVHEGGLESMRHLKNEVDTIKKDVECGLRLNDDTVSFQPGDILQCYEIKHVKQETQWDPGF
uniref:Translation initiation factor IF- 2 domain-containing protein n=1 Tax=Timema monikensis TaxID=170555 RepID=A0A7R9EDG1_9NEOP|nr:unnamed protein product [Timema monikensis]